MTRKQYAVILLRSTSHAIKAEKALQATGLACKLIPVPRHISSDCGLCIRVRRDDGEQAVRALEAAQVEIRGIHPT